MCGKRSKQQRRLAIAVAEEYRVGPSKLVSRDHRTIIDPKTGLTVGVSCTWELRGYRRLYRLLKRGFSVPYAVKKAKAA